MKNTVCDFLLPRPQWLFLQHVLLHQAPSASRKKRKENGGCVRLYWCNTLATIKLFLHTHSHSFLYFLPRINNNLTTCLSMVFHFLQSSFIYIMKYFLLTTMQVELTLPDNWKEKWLQWSQCPEKWKLELYTLFYGSKISIYFVIHSINVCGIFCVWQSLS